MDLSKYLKSMKGADDSEESEASEGAYDYSSESLKIVKRVLKCSDEDAQDLVMALCQLIEDHEGPGIVVKIKS